ncbi:MAG: hypothetical protein V4753_16865 [Pseudomonadota bacterium]
MTLVARYITTADASDLTFSVCSLVQSQQKYDRLLASFARQGFTAENSEFLAADNRDVNRFDGFSWHKALLAEARGRFVIFCHDDIELLDQGFAELLGWTRWLDETDPHWLVAGIAGGVWRTESHPKPALALHITDKFGGNRRRGTLPSRVESLDECFTLMRRARPVISAYDIGGFHLYGTDLCLQAELLGGSAYAIDFHLRHTGQGIAGGLYRSVRRRFVRKYETYFPKRKLNTVNGFVEFGSPEGPAGG